jgi:hypothetical protein
MKHLIIIATILIATSLVHANTVCSITTTSADDQTYDRILLQTEVTSEKFIVISRDYTSAKEVPIEGEATLEYWKAMNGQPFVSIYIDEEGAHGLTIGKIQTGKGGVVDGQILTQPDVMALGRVTQVNNLLLMSLRQKVSVACLLKQQ